MSGLQLPTYQLEVAFTNNPLDSSPTWTDITSNMESFSIQAGRQHALDRTQAGTLKATLNNRDGRFSPWNTSSPYFSASAGYGVTVAKPVRLLATNASVTYPLFYGFVDNWSPKPFDALNEDVELNATDAFKLLSLRYLTNDVLYPNTVLADSPAVFWRMDESSGTVLNDSSGNNQPGYLSGLTVFNGGANPGDVLFGQNGPIVYDPATSADFADGTGAPASYVPTFFSYPSPTPLGTYTFEIWLNTTYNQLPQVVFQWLCNAGGGSNDCMELVIAQPGECQLVNVNQTSTVPASGSVLEIDGPVVNDGLWHHVVVTLSGNLSTTATWTLFVDGTNWGSFATTTEKWNFTNSGPLIVAGFVVAGGGTDETAPAFVGNLANFALYNAVLTGTRIQAHFNTGYIMQTVDTTGQRIADVLTIGGFSALPTNLDTGTVFCQGETSSTVKTACLDYIQQVNDTENGTIYVDPTGTLQFNDRHSFYTASVSNTSQGTFGDNTSTTLHYEVQALSIVLDDLDVWPDVVTARNNGIAQEATNAAGITSYGYRSLQRTSLLFVDDPTTLYLAQGLVYMYNTPEVRVPGLTLSSTANGGANLPQMLGRALWDRVTIQRKDPGSTQLSTPLVVESIRHQYDANKATMTTTWVLSPYEIAKNFFILGTSQLGGPAVLGF